MEGTVKERLEEYLSVKKISKAKFCNALGVSQSYIASIRKSISDEKKAKIMKEFPDLNMDWLITGEGSMLKDDTVHFKQIYEKNEPGADVRAYIVENERLRAQVELLKELLDKYMHQ